jgi:uncharacterized membrane protein YoaK (UPF0700 family)
VNLVFVTGDLNNFARRLAMGIRRAPVPQAQGAWDNHWWRATFLAGTWAAFFIGAVFGATVASRIAVWALLLPVLMLLVFGLLDRAAI